MSPDGFVTVFTLQARAFTVNNRAGQLVWHHAVLLLCFSEGAQFFDKRFEIEAMFAVQGVQNVGGCQNALGRVVLHTVFLLSQQGLSGNG